MQTMKIEGVILLVLLLKVVCQHQEICGKEELPVAYYIYNANVNITIYPCIVNGIPLTNVCNMYNYSKTANISDHDDIVDECTINSFPDSSVYREGHILYFSDDTKVFLTLCELPGSAKLLSNTVEARIGSQRLYNKGKQYDEKNDHFLFWRTDFCRDLNLIYQGLFDVWTLQNEAKYIHNEQISLKLNQKSFFCGSEMWTSNYDGIIVSPSYIRSSVGTKLIQKLQTNFLDCHVTSKVTEEYAGTVPIDSTNSETTFYNNSEAAGFEFPLSINQTRQSSNKEYSDSTQYIPKSCKSIEKISELKTLIHFLTYAAVLFVLWYVFNVIVNFSSLWRFGKMGTCDSRVYLMYCLSQSLTNRYLYLDQWPDDKNGISHLQPSSNLYEVME